MALVPLLFTRTLRLAAEIVSPDARLPELTGGKAAIPYKESFQQERMPEAYPSCWAGTWGSSTAGWQEEAELSAGGGSQGSSRSC